MRRVLIISLLVLLSGCAVPVRAPIDVRVTVKAKGKLRVPAPSAAGAEAEVYLPPPPAPVALEGAPVPEFFGIPLDDAQDIVFVLDVSGSMEEPASGRIAELSVLPPAASHPDGPPPPPPGSGPGAPPSGAEPGPPADAYGPGDPCAARDYQPELPYEGDPCAPFEPYGPGDPRSIGGYDERPAGELGPEYPADEPAAPLVPRKIDVARAELVHAIERLEPGTRMNVLFFNNRLEAMAATIVGLDEPGRDALVHFVLSTEPYGPTALAPALRTALSMNPRRLVLLSDGLGNVGGDASAVLRDAREAMLGGVRIDTIGIGQAQDDRLLRALAEESGGLYQAL